MTVTEAPPAGTVERWCFDVITGTDLATKCHPPQPPRVWEADPPERVLTGPGRPPELTVLPKSPKSIKPRALLHAHRRAEQFHTFLHHELQAAELLCWALLAFPDTPRAFRQGLLAIAREEFVHLGLYEDYLHELDCRYGDHPVRDWFWLRVPTVQGPVGFVALLGMGLEGGNLDHAQRFAALLRDVGDERGAALQERVGRDEVRHVRFAVRWFRRFTGGLDFAAWRRSLPEPLSPALMRGRPLNREWRLQAGLPAVFLDELEQW